ncbi:MAG: HEAT repeat domain-containing protein [Candidatus Heimdallarchaeum aukensis]|uniref:HEAT repeat domain-containing protein n=1 Tax=Candidatus Heimdallarchaeum aukensis TaxID=2876573 RepID=A0A9Y1FM64_9ARCH|nr:MAG: HEAT repeat domain-containing protein [Candidatus Heimdallarchaeum aukensis]
MNIEPSKMKSKFKKGNDKEKIDLLIAWNNLRDPDIADFLFEVIEKEQFYKVRVLAAIQLKNYDSKNNGEKLERMYYREKDESVKIAIIETLAEYENFDSKDFLVKEVRRGLSGIIKGTALRKIHERKKLSNDEMEKILLTIISNENESFPKKLALSLITKYATKKSLPILWNLMIKEENEEEKIILERVINNLEKKYD